MKQGYAIGASEMIVKPNGTITRESASFFRSGLILLDMDFKDPSKYISIEDFLQSDLARPVAMIYTSWKHTNEHNRYRLIIPLDWIETNAARYTALLKALIARYGADENCKDPCRAYYGNTNGLVWNLVTGESPI